MMRILIRPHILLLPLLLLSSSCYRAKLARNLDEGYAERSSEINALMVQLDDGAPAKTLRWKDALSRMNRDNLALERSNQMLEEAERARKRAWRQLVPRVSGYVNLSSGLDNLLDFSSDDINRTLSANFNIPNPFNFYATLYGTGLRYEDAKYSNQLDHRRAYTELYKAFVRAQDLRDELANLQLEMKGTDIMGVEKGVEDLYGLQQRWLSLKRQKQSHRVNINKLLNTPGANWDLVGRLPDISFEKHYRDVEIGEDFGKLAMYLYAIRVETAILRRKQVKMQQWPIMNFGISQPPLYTSGQNNGYELEDFKLFSGASKGFDILDPLGMEQIRDANKRFAYTRKQMRGKMEQEALRLNEMRDAYHQLLLTQERLLQAKKIIESEAADEAEVVLVQLEALKDNRDRLRSNSRQILRLELQYLIWNETFWK